MRKRTFQLNSAVKECECQGASATPFRGAADVFLSIPRVSDQVTVKGAQDSSKQWLQLANLCVKHLVGEEELHVSEDATAKDLVSAAFSSWASKHCSQVGMLDRFTITVSDSPDSFMCDHDFESDETRFLFALVSEQLTPNVNMQEKLELLEKVVPGLARTVLTTIEQAGYQTIEVLTPQSLFYRAADMYWLGNETDEDAKSAMDLEEVDEDDIGLMPSTFKAAFPQWCFDGNTLPEEHLKELIKNGIAAEVVKAVLEVKQAPEHEQFLFMDRFYMTPVYFAAYARFAGEKEEYCMYDRVLDDFYQDTQYVGEYTDIHGISKIPFDEESFVTWRDNAERWFAQYQRLEKLITLVGDFN